MSLDLHELFRLDVGAIELVVRVSVIYLSLLLAMRLVARREMGAFEAPELLMIILIADGVTTAMTGEYTSVTGGLIVGGTLIGWNFLLDWLTFRVPAVERLLRPPPLKLVEGGRVLRRNLRREMITLDELHSHLRQQGIEDVAEVKSAFMEPDGELSVVKRDGAGGSTGPTRPSRQKQRAT
jgi:uncharacterized membrane protein YcaP (DUF421 family)